MSQGSVLKFMRKNPKENYTIEQLSEIMGISIQAIARSVKKLEKDSLIICINPRMVKKKKQAKIVTLHCATCGDEIFPEDLHKHKHRRRKK